MLQAKVTLSAAAHCCVADDSGEEMLRRGRLEMGWVIRLLQNAPYCAIESMLSRLSLILVARNPSSCNDPQPAGLNASYRDPRSRRSSIKESGGESKVRGAVFVLEDRFRCGWL